MIGELLGPMENGEILVYRLAGSVGRRFSEKDPPTDSPVLVAKGRDPVSIILGTRVGPDECVGWVRF